jgi:gas vesicle protein
MKRKQVVTGLLAGAAVGVAVGLLFSPKSGKKTREALAAKSRSARSRVGEYVSLIRHKTPRQLAANSQDGYSKENVESR